MNTDTDFLIAYTNRGFQMIHFTDINDRSCSLQQSSVVIYEEPGTGAVWLGAGDNRMHLNEAMVSNLIKALQNWLDTGKFNRKGELGI
jgi:hypothetical protein